MADAAEFSDKMAELQKMRVALVILLSQETSTLLSRRQRVAGKEIEAMCAERDLEEGGDFDRNQKLLETVYQQVQVAKQALAETEQDITNMEQLMAKVDADIAALCQS